MREITSEDINFLIDLIKSNEDWILESFYIFTIYNGKIFVENRAEKDYSKGTKFILLFAEY
ncbi:MAG: hypothetical protein BAJALOKI2v1_150015 [Promethearchaeota archaeon]|nr:MAG: hypothetical protein BAJALOKI2v1_150015 [Candidatus Lokiarchaeota archaeon]